MASIKNKNGSDFGSLIIIPVVTHVVEEWHEKSIDHYLQKKGPLYQLDAGRYLKSGRHNIFYL